MSDICLLPAVVKVTHKVTEAACYYVIAYTGYLLVNNLLHACICFDRYLLGLGVA